MTIGSRAAHRSLGPGPQRDLVSLFQELRRSSDASNGQLAIATGLSRSHISEVLRGVKAPSPEAAKKIANALGANAQAARAAYVLAEKALEVIQHERTQARSAEPADVTAPAGVRRSDSAKRPVRVLDPYIRRSRIEPMVMVLLPPALLALVLLPAAPLWISLLVALGVILPTVVDHLVRDRGTRVERALFARWGGAPTTQLLRWTGPVARTRQAYTHAQVQKLIGNSLRLPTEPQEAADPAAADEIYEAAILVLRVVDRRAGGDTLVFDENCRYGFRRNALGLRPLGILTAAATLIGTMVGIFTAVAGRSAVVTGALVFVAVLTAILIWLWTSVVTESWVASAAWAYAHRLLETAARHS